MKHLTVLLTTLVGLSLTSCSTTGKSPKFQSQEQADLVFRYYSDQVSHALKPELKQGPFFSILTWPEMAQVAQQQPKKDLAVVILGCYAQTNVEAEVKQRLTTTLKTSGYSHVVILRSYDSRLDIINGLDITHEE